ncbi:MAG: NAD(P)/FAD-dependent oxidoreductase [Gammaproteobacteria bacterium]|jgi:geranylgeranyl reductase family protein
MLDLLIIGGGPAGSTLAWALRDSGLNIAILDKENFPRQKICAGWVTPAVMEELDIDLDDYAHGRVLQPINGFRIGQLGQKQVQSYYSGGPVSYGIRRIEFDNYLLQRSKAKLLTGKAFKQMQHTDYGWCVNNELKAKLVVGAGGHFCPVARAIGAKGVSEVAVAAQEIEFEMTDEQVAACAIDAEVPELFFTPDLKGYGWIFRKQNYLNIGLGREDRHKLSSHVQDFIQYLKRRNKVPYDLPEKFCGHAYLLYPHAIRNIVDDNVLLVGDAAGLAYPQSGEGIRPAVESAILAARVINTCNGDYSAAQLQSYHELIEQRFGQRHPEPGLLERLPLGIKKPVASALMKTEWFTRKIVTDRWFLQAHKEPLNSTTR